MASHISVHLVLEGFATGAVCVPNNRPWFVPNRHSSGKHPIPKLGVFAASRGSRAKTFVENPNPAENFAAEGHIRACPDAPDGDPFVKRALKEKRVKNDRTISAVKAAEVELKANLRLGFQFFCEHKSSHPKDALLRESLPNAKQPTGMNHGIIVGKGDDFARRTPNAAVPCAAEPNNGFWAIGYSHKRI